MGSRCVGLALPLQLALSRCSCRPARPHAGDTAASLAALTPPSRLQMQWSDSTAYMMILTGPWVRNTSLNGYFYNMSSATNMALELPAMSSEILLETFSHLPRRDLYRLALVSLQFKHLSQRLLYRSIDFDFYLPLCPGTTVLEPPNNNLLMFRQLIDTLSQNARLRLFIRAVTIRAGYISARSRFDELNRLLELVPDLQSLTLTPPPDHLDLSTFSLPLLEKLKLTFDTGVINRGNIPMEIIARHFWMPSLRSFSIACCFIPKMHAGFSPQHHRTASITDLQFLSMDDDDVGCIPDIVSCVKSLKRFTFESAVPWDVSQQPATLAPHTFRQFLQVHASTLVHLEIAASDAAKFSHESLYGSLKGYHNLRRLAIPEPFLVIVQDSTSTLVDILPPELEDLQIQFPMLFMQGKDKNRATRVKRLEQLAAAKIQQFPRLKRVVWWSQPAECWDDRQGLRYGPESDMEHLAATFRNVGVQFEWLTRAYFEDTPFGDDADTGEEES
ncbi:hypothetical protein BP6252_06844 [Coleophoma cylindrospora]|uniref:F-box domain-containing protein n=1 Tax=Coleophoma cylindrospora TaxID=1849047 RepID=A0A3D8RFW8_9HELO|nr:hypothetical protein BP6252_06844 [Coleophoma cylindrospora]